MKTFFNIIIFLGFVAVIIFFVDLARAPQVHIPDQDIPRENESISIPEIIIPKEACFYREEKTKKSTIDTSWLRVTIRGSQVSGELRNYPAETDSKIGLFEGTISTPDALGVQKLDTIWQTRAEGMETPEQLIIYLSAEKADVGFGEMVDRGDGTYVYKTPEAIPYFQSIPTISCDDLSDNIAVTTYVRGNIGELSPVAPVLGGRWYVVSVVVNPTLKTGSVVYEDGHIQKTGTFNYSRDSLQSVIISNFVTK